MQIWDRTIQMHRDRSTPIRYVHTCKHTRATTFGRQKCCDRDIGNTFFYHEFDACEFDVRFDRERSVDAERQVGESHGTHRRLEHHAGRLDGQARVLGAREGCIRDGHLRLSLPVNRGKFFAAGDVYRVGARSDRTQKRSSELGSLHRARGHDVLLVLSRTDSSLLESAELLWAADGGRLGERLASRETER